jgi:hypothetical protein
VIRLFAIAGRAVCARPDSADAVTETLGRIIGMLVPPERLAAEECARLWMLFARMAQRAKPSLLEEGGRALYRDLETVGQRLELPPMASWSSLPAGISAAAPILWVPTLRVNQDDDTEPDGARESLEGVRERARALSGRRKRELSPGEVADLLVALNPGAREELDARLVGGGVLGRADLALVEQTIARAAGAGPSRRGGGKARKLGSRDDPAVQTLITIGRWLAE